MLDQQKGFLHLLPLLVVAVVLILGIIVYLGYLKIPQLSFLQKKPQVNLETQYSNPFKKDTQYVNPFNKTKNPFVVGI